MLKSNIYIQLFNMKAVKYLVLMVGLLATLASCSVKKDIPSTSENAVLTQAKWRIVEIAGKPIADKVNGIVPQLSFDSGDKRYSIITGCNTINGTYQSSKQSITFGPGMSTMMFCQDMTVEDGFKSVLNKINSFEIQNNTLFLKDKSTVLVKLVKEVVSPMLVGTTWELDYIAGQETSFSALFPEAKPTLTFDKDGKVFGNASCNRFNTTFTVDGNNIRFGAAATTRMMCPSIKGEQAFLETLGKVNRYDIHDDVLNLIIGDIAVMRFKKK